MNEEIRMKIDELRELLIKEMPYTTTSVNVFFNYQECQITINDRTGEQLKKEGVSMRNLKGDFIK